MEGLTGGRMYCDLMQDEVRGLWLLEAMHSDLLGLIETKFCRIRCIIPYHVPSLQFYIIVTYSSETITLNKIYVSKF